MKLVITTLLLLLTPCISFAGISYESKIALKLHEYPKAIKLLKAQAVKNNADAQYHLALLYRTGKGTKQNNKNAYYWFKKSARNGNVRAQYNCGIILENGYGVPQDKNKALRWYSMAANKGHEKSILKVDSDFHKKSISEENKKKELFKGIKNNKLQAVIKLTKSCTDINDKNKDGDSALLAAIKYASYEITKVIIKCKPDYEVTDRHGNTPLLLAVHSKKSKTVRLLTNTTKETLNTPSKKGLTPLMKSALLDDLKSASYLLRKGAKVNIKDDKGNSAYSFAKVRQHSKMMALLKRNGARIPKSNDRKIPSNIKRKSGQWPLLITAAWRGQNDVIEALLRKKTNPNITDKEGNTALIRAAERGHKKTVQLLLKHSASVNRKNNNGLTPLMAATIKNDTTILRYLIAKKANINLRDKNRMSALMHSANVGNLSAFKELLNHNAKTSYIDKQKRTLIKIAQDRNHQTIVYYIIKNNTISINKKKMGELLLATAANGGIKTIRALSEKGIDLNITDELGNTALMIAANKGFYKTSQYLIKSKADINLKNKHGNTALIFAAQTGRYRVVELLLKSNADSSIRNKNRKTALDIAESKGYRKTAIAISSSEKSGNILGIF